MALDQARLVDMSGDDLVVNAIRYSPAIANQGFNVIDNYGGGPTVVAGTTATLTLPVLKTGFILAANAGATTLTLDTAANIIAALNATGSGAQVGDVILFTVGAKSATATVVIAAGITNPNAVVLATTVGAQRTFILNVTNVTTPALVINA